MAFRAATDNARDYCQLVAEILLTLLRIIGRAVDALDANRARFILHPFAMAVWKWLAPQGVQRFRWCYPSDDLEDGVQVADVVTVFKPAQSPDGPGASANIGQDTPPAPKISARVP